MSTTKQVTKRKQVSTLNVGTVDALKKRARTIRSLYASVGALAEQATAKCNAAVAEAILCGEELNAAKQLVGHGVWGAWLRDNCKDVQDRTARRYMALAKRSHVANLDDCETIRQAYLAVGIIRETESPMLASAPAAASQKVSKSPDNEPKEQGPAPTPEPVPVSSAPVGKGVLVSKEGNLPKLASTAKPSVDVLPVIASSVDDLLALLQRVPASRKAEAMASLGRLADWIRGSVL